MFMCTLGCLPLVRPGFYMTWVGNGSVSDGRCQAWFAEGMDE